MSQKLVNHIMQLKKGHWSEMFPLYTDIFTLYTIAIIVYCILSKSTYLQNLLSKLT